jgi:hypothetical protein
MEEDRLATNLGPEDAEILQTEATSAPRQPKRRFVGRRAAEAAATTNAPNGSIEESTAIQGVKSHITRYNEEMLTNSQSLNPEEQLAS